MMFPVKDMIRMKSYVQSGLRAAAVIAVCALASAKAQSAGVITGAECTEDYYPAIAGKRVAVMSNSTGMVGSEHVVDVLLRDGMNVAVIFSPEHGFRGTADAGEHVASSADERTGIEIRSLYGSADGRPDAESMTMFDVLLIDIQDVGLRFYTYYITVYRLMDACAEKGKKVIVLDRPNPNGYRVDGPLLDMKHRSGVGLLPIPVMHGMTLGELALMINGERWLPAGRACDLTVVRCRNYTHGTLYRLPVAPSPNLPDMKSVYLYPSVCLLEGTVLSVGRGTGFPFQVYGHPEMKGCTYSFTPRSVPGAKDPPLLGRLCRGVDLRGVPDSVIIGRGFDVSHVIHAYRQMGIGERFFTPFFEKLAGADYVRRMIIDGRTAAEISAMWKDDVEQFSRQRAPYLLYAADDSERQDGL